jgi:thioredoxin 1
MSDSRNVRHISDAEFETAVLRSEIPVFIDFWAPWCGPCRIVGPIIDELADAYAGRLSVVKINVDDNPAVAQQFMISSIPTMMIFKGGQVVDRVLGAMPKGELQKLIERNL